MKNKVPWDKNKDRIDIIKREYTDSFIPVSIKELAKMLNMNVRTLGDFMYRFSLCKNKEEQSRNINKFYSMLLNLNKNGFTLKEIADMTYTKYSVLASRFSQMKKGE